MKYDVYKFQIFDTTDTGTGKPKGKPKAKLDMCFLKIRKHLALRKVVSKT